MLRGSSFEKIFGRDSRQLTDFDDINFSLSIFTTDTPDSEFEKAYRGGLDDAKAILNSMAEELDEFNIEDEKESANDDNTYLFILTLLSNFHKVVRQLRNRREKRETLNVKDEYDVQDLLHALLKIKFDDVKVEEWTHSYANKSARMDFLIKDNGIVIEVKKTRDSLNEKEIGDQLILDIIRYKNHPDCKKLICFIYDPEGFIGNPVGLSRDLSRQDDGFSVEIIIKP